MPSFVRAAALAALVLVFCQASVLGKLKVFGQSLAELAGDMAAGAASRAKGDVQDLSRSVTTAAADAMGVLQAEASNGPLARKLKEVSAAFTAKVQERAREAAEMQAAGALEASLEHLSLLTIAASYSFILCWLASQAIGALAASGDSTGTQGRGSKASTATQPWRSVWRRLQWSWPGLLLVMVVVGCVAVLAKETPAAGADAERGTHCLVAAVVLLLLWQLLGGDPASGTCALWSLRAVSVAVIACWLVGGLWVVLPLHRALSSELTSWALVRTIVAGLDVGTSLGVAAASTAPALSVAFNAVRMMKGVDSRLAEVLDESLAFGATGTLLFALQLGLALLLMPVQTVQVVQAAPAPQALRIEFVPAANATSMPAANVMYARQPAPVAHAFHAFQPGIQVEAAPVVAAVVRKRMDKSPSRPANGPRAKSTSRAGSVSRKKKV